jgi:NAD(P)-dependent dehydrogenase (short-subunit alcohol dehydrogenase family)/acyl carrier protein
VALVDGGSANGGITDAGRDARDAAVLEFLRSTRELVTAQRDVLLGYLGSGGFHPPTPVAAVAATVVPADAGPTVTGSNAHGAARTPAQLLQTLLAIVAERTGYPIEMLDPDSDLEADLSIDSIKRTEILGELADRIDLQGAGTDGIDEALAGLKTLRAIVDWIGNHMPAGAAHASRNGLSAITAIADGGEGTVPALPALRRYIVRTEPLPPIPDDQDLKATLEGRSAVIVGGGQSVGMELSTLLASAGVAVLPPGDDSIAGADVVVYLAALDHDHPALPGSYAELRAAVLGAAQWLLIATDVTSAQAPLGAGLRGLARTMALEFPDTVVRAVDVDPGDGPREIAGQLLAELLAPRSPVVVGYRDGTRSTPQVVEAPLHSTRPDADSARAIGLGADSVVLLTGGARGITAEVALGFAGASRCHIELIGRTPASADVEGAADRLPAQRELHATLRKLEAVAASVRYHAVDVRDGQAVAAVVRDVYARHGQLDGVVHGAGIIEDRLLRDKDPASFARVYRTKVDGARALVEALRPDLSFLMLFGSVSGVFGNRGQADYAAANDALDTLSHAWADRFQGRVVAVDWGPWAPAGGGMVSAELERSYTRRGIGMIAPDEGVACLLRELAWGDPALSQVVYMRAPLAAFDRASAVGDPHSPARSPSPSPAAGLAGGSGHG